MKKLRNDRHGVSNVMGYLFSFAIASMVMVSAVFVTMGIIEDKTSQVASLEAQSIANYISNAIAEAVAAKQSNPDAAYEIIWDLPSKIANKDYYIDVANSAVYVNTTDGRVSRISTTYTAEELDIGVFSTKKIHGGEGRVAVIADSSDYLYKLDFGSGDITDHSPVEAGYYFVSSNSLSNTRTINWEIDSHSYRAPIRISNPSSSALVNVPVRVVLNSSNFDYSKANVTAVGNLNGSQKQQGGVDFALNVDSNIFMSDLRFYDPEPGLAIVVGATASPRTWYPHWRWSTNEEINVTLTPDKLPTGMKTDYIDGDTLELDGGGGATAICKSYVGGKNIGDPGYAIFDRAEAFKSLGYLVDGEIRNVSIRGYFKDKTSFTAYCFVTIKFGNFSVDDDFNGTTPGWGVTRFDSIQTAINNANDRDTVYVYEGTYNERITINDNINLVGQDKTNTIIDGTGVSLGSEVIQLTSSVADGNITSFTIKKAGSPNGQANGLFLNGCDNVVVADCDVKECRGVGINIANGATYNKIIGCKSHDNDDFSGYGNNNGLNITGKYTANNIVKNCEFYNNKGPNSNGIMLSDGAHHNLIENCKSYDNKESAGDGIDIMNLRDADQPTSYNTIINCTFYGQTGTSGDGIDIWTDIEPSSGSTYVCYNTIINCTSYNNADEGIGLQYGHCNTVRDCRFYNNGNEGVFIYSENDSEVINCEVYNNGGNGVLTGPYSRYNKILNCDIHDNGGNGVKIYDVKLTADGAYENEVRYCEIYDNDENGVLLEYAQNNTFQYCNMYSNDESGLVIEGELGDDPAWITYCNFFDNTLDGLRLLGTDPVHSTEHITVTDCNFYSNDRYGVYINRVGAGDRYPKNNLIYRNNFANNTEDNAYDNTRDEDDNYWSFGGEGNYWDDLLDNPAYPGPHWYDIQPSAVADSIDYFPRGPGHESGGDWDDFWTIPNIIHVNEDYTSEQLDWFHTTTIQKAIDHVIPGGTVIVHTEAHQYPQSTPLIINKSLRLIGDGLTDITYNGAGPVINVTAITASGILPPGFSRTVYIDGFDIHGATGTGTGIYVKVDPYPSGVIITDISNCYIHNKGNGTYFGTSKNNITNCRIYSNTNSGIYLHTSNSNNIKNCDIYSNTKSGIHLYASDRNNINNSYIYSNQECGINLTSGSDRNNITYSTIASNRYGIRLLNSGAVDNGNTIKNCVINGQTSVSKHGISLEGDSKGNVIKLCSIYDIKGCGINITGTSTNNKIFSNNFGCKVPVGLDFPGGGDVVYLYNGLNAWDSAGSNKWNETKANGGGNYWDDYSGVDADFDGFGDSAYSIPGGKSAQDKLPLAVPYDDPNYYRPFSIEYWNPDGNSILLVNVTVDAGQEKDIYLYYGSNQRTAVSFASIAEFYDGFTTFDTTKWYWSGMAKDEIPEEWAKEKAITLQKDGFIITQNDVIKEPLNPDNKVNAHTASEAMYIVEACVRFNNSEIRVGGENQANTILLSTSFVSYYNSYLFSIHNNVTEPGNLTLLHKRYQDMGINKKLDSYNMDRLFDRWWLMKSYIYLGKHNYTLGANINRTDVTYITSFVYDYTTLANESEVSYTDGWYTNGADTNEIVGDTGTKEPFLKGKVGIGCGLLSGFSVNDSANVTVDWIRVRKAPVVPPVVTVGAMESMNYGWNTQVTSANRVTSDPFKPGPLLRDLNNYPEPVNFIIKNIPNGTYSIAITKGDNTYNASGMTVNITDDNNNPYPSLEFSNTTKGSFETKWVTIEVSDVDNSTNLILTFDAIGDGTDVGPAVGWRINALTVERGQRGVEVTLG